MRPILRNIKTNVPYEYLGSGKFRNLITQIEGQVPDEKAKEVFKFNIDATQLINEYPLIENLIQTLKLKFDNIKIEQNEK